MPTEPEEIATKLGASRHFPVGRVKGPLDVLALGHATRLCARSACSHLFAEHTGSNRECDCCRCPAFVDEPDFVASGSVTG